MSNLVDWLVENEPLFRKARLPSLYSDLAVQKSTNPEGYAANVIAWQSALARAAAAGQLSNDHRLVISASEELLDALASPQYGRPSGLGLVLDEGVKSGKIFSLKEFQDAEQSVYQHNWIPSPWTVLRWGMKQAGLAGNVSYNQAGRLRWDKLVPLSTLEGIYKQINATQKSKGNNLTDRIMTRDEFNQHLARCGNEPLSSQDTDILLRYLARDKQLLSYDFKTVKFKSSVSEMPEPITSEDTTIANLNALIKGLEHQISNLTARISTLQKNAKSAVEAKNKAAALSALRSKKLAEATLQQRTSTLSQLEEVYTKIEQAVDQVQIVEAMQSSVSVLKGLNKKIGGVDKVEDVVEELREEMGKIDEVGQVLEEPLDGKMILDEAEVDDELEQMEKEEKKKEVEREREREREAEITRKRLAEVEQPQNQVQSTADKEAEHELNLKASIEQLEKTNITDHQDAQELPQQSQIPEHAS